MVSQQRGKRDSFSEESVLSSLFDGLMQSMMPVVVYVVRCIVPRVGKDGPTFITVTNIKFIPDALTNNGKIKTIRFSAEETRMLFGRDAGELASTDNKIATQIAKDMEVPITAKLLNKILNEARIIYKSGGTWVLYEEHAQYEDRLMSVKETKPNVNGNTYTSSRWTVEGKKWILGNWATAISRCTPETRAKWEAIRDGRGSNKQGTLPKI